MIYVLNEKGMIYSLLACVEAFHTERCDSIADDSVFYIVMCQGYQSLCGSFAVFVYIVLLSQNIAKIIPAAQTECIVQPRHIIFRCNVRVSMFFDAR